MMEHMIMNSDGIICLVNQIGCFIEDTFIIAEECTDTLEQLISMVENDGASRCKVLHVLGILDVLPKSLIPLIIHLNASENSDLETSRIFGLATRLMMCMTRPTEAVLSSGPPQFLSSAVLGSLQGILWTYKNLFLEKDTIPAFFSHIKRILHEVDHLPDSECETLNACLLLIRNLLFITPHESPAQDSHYTDTILSRLLLMAGLPDLVIRLALMDQHALWSPAIVQILSLLYKKSTCPHPSLAEMQSAIPMPTYQQTNILTERIDVGEPAKYSWRTDVKHCPSHTSPSGNMDGIPLPELPPTESGSPGSQDSSTKALEGSSHAGSGFSTVFCMDLSSDSQGSGSSSRGSEEDKQLPEVQCEDHLQASLMQIETRICLKLNEFKVKQELTLFTNAMLQKGVFENLLQSLNLVDGPRRVNSRLPNLYLMWLIVHFLRAAPKADVSFDKIRSCLTVDVVSYLTYIGVTSVEEMQMALQTKGSSYTLAARRSHLVVLALHEVLNTLQVLLGSEQLSPTERSYINTLAGHMIHVKDLGSLLLLFIRHCKQDVHGSIFLRDAVVLNHNYLIMAEHALNLSPDGRHWNFNMFEHVKKFATMEVMAQYGILLKNFKNNSPVVNDCIFTMMHHVAGDLQAPQVLMQLPILKSFLLIWDDKTAYLPQECADLIQFILDRFIMEVEMNPLECANFVLGQHGSDMSDFTDDSQSVASSYMSDDAQRTWLLSELDELYIIYQDLSDQPVKDSLHLMVESLAEKGIVRTKEEVFNQLVRMNICQPEDLSSSKNVPASHDERNMNCDMQSSPSDSLSGSAGGKEYQEAPAVSSDDQGTYSNTGFDNAAMENDEDPNKNGVGCCREIDPQPSGASTDDWDVNIEDIVRTLRGGSFACEVDWLQQVFLDACYIKIGGRKLQDGKFPEEPVALYFILQNKSVPIVPYLERQEEALNNSIFRLLLAKLGVHFPEDSGQIYPRIPHFWMPAELMASAKRLGPVNFDKQPFNEEDVTQYIATQLVEVYKALKLDTAIPKPTEKSEPKSTLWNAFIRQCNISNQQSEAV